MRDFVEERALLADALLFGFLLAPSPIFDLNSNNPECHFLKFLERLSQNRNRTGIQQCSGDQRNQRFASPQSLETSMHSSASTRRNRSSSSTTKGGNETMSSNADAMPRRRFRARGSRRRLLSRGNMMLGIFLFTIILVFLFLGSFSRSSAKTDLDLFNKNLRGGSDERSIWVSQNSQPFVSTLPSNRLICINLLATKFLIHK